MKRMLLFLLLFLPLLYAQTEECVKCDEVAMLTPTKMVVISDEINYLLKISLYNATSKQPLPNTVIIIHRYNNTVRAFEKVFTDEQGSATYNFSAYIDNCYTYQILFCSCEKDAVKKCCFEINNIDITKPNTPDSIDDIPLATNQPQMEPSEIIYNYKAFPSTEVYSYCKPQTEATSTPAFCLPLAIIFALLGGSLMLTGRNPLRGFDFGGIRLGRHIKYESRGRFAGYSVSPVQITGVIRKTKAEKVEKAMAVAGETKGRVSTIADRFRRQVIAPVKGVPIGIRQAKGAIAAGRKFGITARYTDTAKLIGRAGLQAISTPIDALRTSVGGPEMMIGPDGRAVPIRRGVEERGGGLSGIFALLGAILPANINMQKLQIDCYELLKTKGERIADSMLLQERRETLIDRTRGLTTFHSVTEKGGKEYKNVSFTLEKAHQSKVEEHELLDEKYVTTPDGKKAFVVRKQDRSVALVPEGTPLYSKFTQKIKESEEIVGKIRVEIPGNGIYSIGKDESGKITVYKEGTVIDINDPKVQNAIKDPDYDKFRWNAGCTFTKIDVSDGAYSFSKNDKGEIVAYASAKMQPENITNTNLGAAIITAYKEVIKTNSDFIIGKKSETWASYNEVRAEWEQAKAMVHASQVEFAKSNLEDVKEGFLKQPEIIEAADEIMARKAIISTKEILAEDLSKIAGKELQQRIFNSKIMLDEGIALIDEYGKVATPEKLKEEERATVERYVTGAKDKGESARVRVEEQIRQYNKKINAEIDKITNELAAGMDMRVFEIRRKQAELLSSYRDYLESRVEGDNEKAVDIVTNLLDPSDPFVGAVKDANNPFVGAVELERLTRDISGYYAHLYERQDYGRKDGGSSTLEYEKRLDEIVASEGLVLKATVTNKGKVQIITETRNLLDEEQSKLKEERPASPSAPTSTEEKTNTDAKDNKST